VVKRKRVYDLPLEPTLQHEHYPRKCIPDFFLISSPSFCIYI
jgi:hypothetical protein